MRVVDCHTIENNRRDGIIVESQNGLITIETDCQEASVEQIQDLFKTK